MGASRLTAEAPTARVGRINPIIRPRARTRAAARRADPVGAPPRGRRPRGVSLARRVRSREPERTVRALAVVMVDVGAKHSLQLAAADDQEPVEALPAHRAQEPLGDRVRLRGPDRRADDLNALAAEHLIERVRELAVAIVDQEPQRALALRQRPGRVSRLLREPVAVRSLATAGEVDAAAPKLDERRAPRFAAMRRSQW